MRKYNNINEQSYERGFRDGYSAGLNELKDRNLYESETEEIGSIAKDSWYSLMEDNYYGKWLHLDEYSGIYFFESPREPGRLSIKLDVQFDEETDSIWIDASGLVAGSFNHNKLYLTDICRILFGKDRSEIRGELSLKGKDCKTAFKRFLTDILNGKFKNVNLSFRRDALEGI